ncbi:KTSC domain-containing protein [Formosa algae]|uniref:DnaJ-class molecular chaperone n=1 Tax=Formosa algae TaxID=225843 RepID=A0A9X0YLF8_9FLAO|nr:KTSC domain-containing protein [Formosa algae]MBP1840937.1 DnaJ-class molecular chaperone [Formosa algae]MDQ0336166.1 DnaJ-class molecular chaperone [Formosa algae]OEI79944.1 molecular chaperone DnaJ [Formosa algae]PNW28287.1 molecular chaperone DnaJ [Formosa algae]
MKRITEYRKLFEVDKDADLKTLKKQYRNLAKEWHPDKFQAGDPLVEEAEAKTRKITDGYHFLVSIAPETREANKDTYNETINSGVADFQWNSLVLEITFVDGSTYEYFGVTKPIYIKMINSDKVSRFAKRNIFPKYIYRKSKRTVETA